MNTISLKKIRMIILFILNYFVSPNSLPYFDESSQNIFHNVFFFSSFFKLIDVNVTIFIDLELLSIAMHLAESRCLKQQQVIEVKYLLDVFVQQFPSIYSVRHHTQVVHSLVHVSKTIANFGPLQNFSTFSFESILGNIFRFSKSFVYTSILGNITSSVHGTRMHAQEIKNNIALLRLATADIEREDFNEQLKLFYIGMGTSKKQQCLATIVKSSFKSTHLSAHGQLDENETFSIQQRLHCKMSQPFYKVLFVGKVKFKISDGKVMDDGCVAFEDGNGTLEAGFIRAIQHSKGSNSTTVIHVEKFIIQKCLSTNVDVTNQSLPVNIICSDFAVIQLSGQIVPISPNSLVEKLSYIQTNSKDFIIIRYPNLLESS